MMVYPPGMGLFNSRQIQPRKVSDANSTALLIFGLPCVAKWIFGFDREHNVANDAAAGPYVGKDAR